MKHTGLLAQLKASGLKLHPSRLKFLSLLMIAMVQAKTGYGKEPCKTLAGADFPQKTLFW